MLHIVDFFFFFIKVRLIIYFNFFGLDVCFSVIDIRVAAAIIMQTENSAIEWKIYANMKLIKGLKQAVRVKICLLSVKTFRYFLQNYKANFNQAWSNSRVIDFELIQLKGRTRSNGRN